MENQAAELQSYEDVCKSGYLRKQKSMHRRYFVLRSASERGPARLEYYETEKKFRSKAPVPKKALNLETCFNINKRADSKNKHMIVLYTRGESFAVAADSEEVQSEWYQAMLDLQFKSKTPSDSGSGGESGSPFPGPAFKEVWQVKVWPKGLGQARNLVGIYRLCLTDKTVNFVKLNSDAPAVVLQLMNVRRCGHSENFFFVEVGRSAMTGPGEFWMQVEDSVVAQNMHETLLEAMKALSEEFRQRTKSQSAAAIGGGTTASNPISVPSRRHHPNPPPSQVGFSRRARTETPGTGGGSSTNTSPTARHGFSRARTASIGGRVEEGRAAAGGAAPSSSPSLNGSCSTTPTPMPKTTRAPTPAKIPLSLVRYTPNPVPSPAPSLSSSSGHGSECGIVGGGVFGGAVGVYSRASQRVSVSGSPSDYGSSDEYGSSPDQPGGSSKGLGYPASVKSGSNYIAMGQQGGASRKLQSHTRRVLRRSSSRECEAERRLLSKRASLPPIALDRLNSRRREEEEGEDEDYTVMCRSASRESFTSPRESGMVAAGDEGSRGGVADNGYMSMLPGVTASSVSLSLSLSVAASDSSPKMDDYMAMTPNSSISPPQQIQSLSSEGYMLMSPSSSCSPDQHGMGTLGVVWGGKSSVESRAGSDYMNMSPISVRSACSTPPPDSEQNPQQGTPKTVHSYFSLPRSYKHTLTTHIEDGPGQGNREGGSGNNSRAGRGRGVGCSNRHESTVGSARGRHMSPSSSSYSSSSASTESLEDKLTAGGQRRGTSFRTGEACSAGGVFQQRRGLGVLKQSQQQQRRSQPNSLFVDMSKASTLPRVRENPLPPVPQSPGEYVSIQFRGDAGGRGRGGRLRGLGQGLSLPRSPLGPIHRPDSCSVGFQTLPRSLSAPLTTTAASEYINMDFGAPPSPSPVSLTTFGFPSFNAPTTLPAIALKAKEECPMVPQEAEGADVMRRKHGVTTPVTPELPSSCADYTEMAFSLDSSSPSQCVSHGSPSTHTAQASAMELSLDFPVAKTSTNPNQGARVVRADPQGRRRHCSESFLVSSPLPLSSSSSLSLFPEHTQTVPRQLRFEGAAWGSGPSVASQCSNPGPAAALALSVEQGLNYIDLDLANKESPHTTLEGPAAIHPPPPRLFASFLGGGTGGNMGGAGGGCSIGSNLNTYASIDFLKSEELRTHQNTNKDSPECGS